MFLLADRTASRCLRPTRGTLRPLSIGKEALPVTFIQLISGDAMGLIGLNGNRDGPCIGSAADDKHAHQIEAIFLVLFSRAGMN